MMIKEFNQEVVESKTLSVYKKHKLISKTKREHSVTKKRAFTLLELLVVIAILAMLATFVVPEVVGRKDEAQRDIACTQMASIANVLETFKMDNSAYPDTEEGLEALLSNPDPEKYPQYARNPYYKKLPKDTWGTPYTYIKTEDGFKIISYAGDRKEGGTGGDEDIVYPGCEEGK